MISLNRNIDGDDQYRLGDEEKEPEIQII